MNQGPETEIRHREFLEKHCVLGRNYHLQDIQLSKSFFARAGSASARKISRERLALQLVLPASLFHGRKNIWWRIPGSNR